MDHVQQRPKRSVDQRTVNPSHRNTAGSSPAPSTFRLRVREVYGASPFHSGRRKADVPRTSCDLLRWRAATHRRFESFRKRSRAGIGFLAFSCRSRQKEKDRRLPVQFPFICLYIFQWQVPWRRGRRYAAPHPESLLPWPGSCQITVPSLQEQERPAAGQPASSGHHP